MTASSGSGSDTSGLYGERGAFGERSRSSERGESGESDAEQPRVVIRDKRRIDPETGAVREAPSAPPAGSPAAQNVPDSPQGVPDSPQGVAKELAERTEDLKRVSAEYANYRRRVDRDRVLIGELAQARLVLDLLPVMDDIDRAREHGDLTGAYKSTADQLTGVLDRAGVQAFGEIGDPFDPGLHEAVLHEESPEVTVASCTHVMRRGYRRGERVLRAAMVGVADPQAAPAQGTVSTESTESTESTVDGERT